MLILESQRLQLPRPRDGDGKCHDCNDSARRRDDGPVSSGFDLHSWRSRWWHTRARSGAGLACLDSFLIRKMEHNPCRSNGINRAPMLDELQNLHASLARRWVGQTRWSRRYGPLWPWIDYKGSPWKGRMIQMKNLGQTIRPHISPLPFSLLDSQGQSLVSQIQRPP